MIRVGLDQNDKLDGEHLMPIMKLLPKQAILTLAAAMVICGVATPFAACAVSACSAEAPDLLVADFEGKT